MGVCGISFYDESRPTITHVEFSGDTYTAIPSGGVMETVTLYFSEKIRFADNAAHDDITLNLDAEYLSQSDSTRRSSCRTHFLP